MKTSIALIAGLIMAGGVFAETAHAQPGPPPGSGGYGPPPGAGPMLPMRRGITYGVSGGIGGISSENYDTSCIDCGGNPLAVGGSGYIGIFLNPRMAVLGDLSVTSQTLDQFYGDYLLQTQVTANLRYWVMPRLWLQGGLGFSNLTVNYNDGGPGEPLDAGGAMLLAAGFDFLVGPRFSWDANFNVRSGGYKGLGANVTSAMVSISANWFQ